MFSSIFTPVPHSSVKSISETEGLPSDNITTLTTNVTLYLRLAAHTPNASELPVFRTQLQSQLE